jgi:PAT family beta-lactamase induction signal transducer AmpG
LPPNPEKIPPAWLIGLTFLPFGIVLGLSATALPFLLTKAGVSVDRVASISALVLSPSFWGVLLAPIVDTGMTRRTHAFVLAAISVCCIGVGLWFLSPVHLGFLAAAVLTGNLAIYLYGAAISGWQADFVPDSIRGKAGGWTNAANLGGSAGGALITMELAQKLSLHAAAVVLVILISLSVLPAVFLPTPAKPKLVLRRAIPDTLRGVWETSKQRSSLIGFALFLSPTGAFGAGNLFSGLGTDFHSSPQQVIAITGAGVSIASSIGAIVGGFLADRFSRGYVYLAGGMIAGGCGLALAFSRLVPLSFVTGVLAYSVAVGVSYAGFSALALQLTGAGHVVAATQITLFGSVGNAAISYMTWADGQGYRLFGVRGLFYTDSAASLLAALPLLLLVHRELQRSRRTATVAQVSE